MSVQATSWVWECSKSEGNARFVLLAIADSANPAGEDSWLSVDTIVRMTKITKRTVQRCLRHLEELGELEVSTAARGRGHMTIYRLSGMGKGDIVTSFPKKKGVRVTSFTKPSSATKGRQKGDKRVTTLGTNGGEQEQEHGLSSSNGTRAETGRGAEIVGQEHFENFQRAMQQLSAAKGDF